MQDLIVIGASYRTLGMEALGRLMLSKTDLPQQLPGLATALGVRELVYVGTCNRVELCVVRPTGLDPRVLRTRALAALHHAAPSERDAERAFRLWSGSAALEHMMSVTCGLDSARVGDREIATQVRDAWHIARRAGSSGPRLDDAIASALAAAREVARDRCGPDLGRGLAQRAVDHVLAAGNRGKQRVALIGVSPMTRAAGRALVKAGAEVIVVNRSSPAREHLAAELGGASVTWEEFWAGAHPVHALISAVGSLEPVAKPAVLARLGQLSPAEKLFVVDLGVPANVGEDTAKESGVAYVGMDQLIAEAAADRPGALLESGEIRAVLERHLNRAQRTAATRAAGPLLGVLRARFESSVNADLEQLLGGELTDLDAAQQDVLRRWGMQLAHRMAHVPLQGLRSLAGTGEFEQVEDCVRAMRIALEADRGAKQ